MGKLIVEDEVENKAIYGRWRIEQRVGDSRRHVMARCLDCDTLYRVDLFQLRRKDRANNHCRGCANRVKSISNQLPKTIGLIRSELHSYKKSAVRRGLEWKLSEDEFRSLLVSKCFYCGAEPQRMIESSWDSMLVSGIDRRDNSVGYTVQNSVSCCKDCNYAKRNMTEEKFFEMIGRIYEYHRSRYRASPGGLRTGSNSEGKDS